MVRKITHLLVFVVLLIVNAAFAQVGIDNPLPDNNAILDLKASDKGILIPRMTTVQRFAMITSCSPSCPDGLLVFDTNRKAFFFLNVNQWYAMTPFTTPDASSGSNEDITTDNVVVQDVGIGIAPTAGYKLHVNGATRVETDLYVNNNLTVQTGNVVVNTGSLNVASSISSGSSIGASGVLQGSSYGATGGATFRSDGASNFSGPVPRGGIIMWSGSASNIPPGWAICDGSSGTPDLKGRFVLGNGGRSEATRQSNGSITFGSAVSFAVDATGGADKIILSSGEMPDHSHSGTTNTDGGHKHTIYYSNLSAGGSPEGNMVRHENTNVGADGSTETNNGSTDGTHSHSFTTSNTGSDLPHMNMPPYYVLAYIMKL
ncbi:MAG: hypothetical protein ACKVOU_05165 [Cytophagales bacterium]